MTTEPGSGHDVVMYAAAAASIPQTAPDVGALFDAHAEELCRLVHRLTGSREVAEEVVQDVFVTAWNRRADLEGLREPRAWLYRVAVNHVRHRRRAYARLTGFLSRWRTEPEAPGRTADDEAERTLAARRIHRVVAAMPDKQREVFVLYELQELSGQEIAEILGINENTMWGRLRLARETFRRHWDGEVA